MLGTGLGIGLGLSEAPTSTVVWQFYPAVPSGWKAVSYRGVVLDVPRSWVVSNWKYPCGPYVPTVLLGPEPKAFLKYFCPAYTRGAAEVDMGAWRPAGITHDALVNGNRIGISFSNTKATYDFGKNDGTNRSINTSVDSVDVHISGIWITIEVGTSTFEVGTLKILAGGAPSRAMQIVRSIHAASG